jgi:hypothetical protein
LTTLVTGRSVSKKLTTQSGDAVASYDMSNAKSGSVFEPDNGGVEPPTTGTPLEAQAINRLQWAGYGEEGQKALVERIAMKRLGTPQDIANSAVFFASELAGFVNGQVLAVDGEK